MRLQGPLLARVVEQCFGKIINPRTMQQTDIKRYTICNDSSMSVSIITLGASINSIKVPNAKGFIEDVVLGFDKASAYMKTPDIYMGNTIGLVSNRIRNAKFTYRNQEIELSRNYKRKHHQHGGIIGLSRIPWSLAEMSENSVELCVTTPEGYEGYPATVDIKANFAVSNDNCLRIRMTAHSKQKVFPINMTNNTYFNLACHSAGKLQLYKHAVMISSNRIVEEDCQKLATGALVYTEGTVHDLRNLANLGDRILQTPGCEGFDDSFVVVHENDRCRLPRQAQITHCPSGRFLSVYSNQPTIVFSTANKFPNTDNGECPMIGKDGAMYQKHGAFSLQTQQFPDAPNHSHFPSIMSEPGKQYVHEVVYKFGLSRKDGKYPEKW